MHAPKLTLEGSRTLRVAGSHPPVEFIWEDEIRKMAVKKIREIKRGRKRSKALTAINPNGPGWLKRCYAEQLKTGAL